MTSNALQAALSTPATTPNGRVEPVTGPDWVASLPMDVRLALAACEAEGMAVDEYSDGAHRPVFYEVAVDFAHYGHSVGSAMGEVGDAIEAECNRYGVESEHVFALRRQIRMEAVAGDYTQGLNRLMHWVAIATDEDDD